MSSNPILLKIIDVVFIAMFLNFAEFIFFNFVNASIPNLFLFYKTNKVNPAFIVLVSLILYFVLNLSLPLFSIISA